MDVPDPWGKQPGGWGRGGGRGLRGEVGRWLRGEGSSQPPSSCNHWGPKCRSATAATFMYLTRLSCFNTFFGWLATWFWGPRLTILSLIMLMNFASDWGFIFTRQTCKKCVKDFGMRLTWYVHWIADHPRPPTIQAKTWLLWGGEWTIAVAWPTVVSWSLWLIVLARDHQLHHVRTSANKEPKSCILAQQDPTIASCVPPLCTFWIIERGWDKAKLLQ